MMHTGSRTEHCWSGPKPLSLKRLPLLPQALNDLFEKLLQRDIPSRYLLRLGMGEAELQTEDDFSRAGRVNTMLARRIELLAEVSRLRLRISLYWKYIYKGGGLPLCIHRPKTAQKRMLRVSCLCTRGKSSFTLPIVLTRATKKGMHRGLTYRS